jgi:hypothetical protein
MNGGDARTSFGWQTKFLRVFVAGVALALMTPSTTRATTRGSVSDTNYCSPCQELSDISCGVVLLSAIVHCCGSGGEGVATCSPPLDKYAVACEGGGGCLCGDWGDNCDPEPDPEPDPEADTLRE